MITAAASAHAPYDDAFYDRYRQLSAKSAWRVLPHVVRLLAPRSVVDVGCGVGAWLATFMALGVDDVLGVDGDYVRVERLMIPRERFRAADLAQPLHLARAFDLAMSVEVAEHVPEAAAATFVDSLTRLSDAVLFSAAIPHQGGTGHVNEQWPEYWAAHFAQRGYRVLDCIRPAVWDDADVEYYYAQNTLLYVHDRLLARSPRLQSLVTPPQGLARVHPRKWLELAAFARNQPRLMSPRQLLAALPHAVRRAVARRLA
jgi:SAM-dependent methyltransferase